MPGVSTLSPEEIAERWAADIRRSDAIINELVDTTERLIAAWEHQMRNTPHALKGHPNAREIHQASINARAEARSAIARAKGATHEPAAIR